MAETITNAPISRNKRDEEEIRIDEIGEILKIALTEKELIGKPFQALQAACVNRVQYLKGRHVQKEAAKVRALAKDKKTDKATA